MIASRTASGWTVRLSGGYEGTGRTFMAAWGLAKAKRDAAETQTTLEAWSA